MYVQTAYHCLAIKQYNIGPYYTLGPGVGNHAYPYTIMNAGFGLTTEHTTISISCYELYRTYGSSMANKVQRHSLQLGVARLEGRATPD